MLSINWKGYRFAAWVGQTLLAIAVLASAVQGKWQNAIALPLFLIVSLVFVAQFQRLRRLEGDVLDLVLDYNKEQSKEVSGSFLVKHYGCLAPGAMSTLS